MTGYELPLIVYPKPYGNILWYVHDSKTLDFMFELFCKLYVWLSWMKLLKRLWFWIWSFSWLVNLDIILVYILIIASKLIQSLYRNFLQSNYISYLFIYNSLFILGPFHKVREATILMAITIIVSTITYGMLYYNGRSWSFKVICQMDPWFISEPTQNT